MGNDFAIKDFPKDWTLTTLGEMLDQCNGSVQTGPFGSQLHASDYVEVGIPSVMPKNITIEDIDESDIARISIHDAQRLSKYLLDEGDIVYSRRGDVEKCALVTVSQIGWLCGTGCLRIRLGDDAPISPSYLHAYLSSPAMREWISRNAIGATMPNLNTSILRDVPLLIPVNENVKFVENIWNCVNTKLRLNKKTNQTLEHMAQALFKSWFVDFDPVIDNALAAGNDIPEALQHKAEQRKHAQQLPDFNPLPDNIRALFPSEFEQTNEPNIGIFGWIPKGWSAGSLSSLANFTSNRIDGTELTRDNYISTDNMLSNKGGVSTASKVPDIKTTPSFKPGDILISNIRPYFQKIWFATFSGGRSNDVLGFEAIDEQCKEYLLNLLYQDVFFDYMMTTSKGSKMPRGDKKAIMDWPVVIPPSSLQKFFSEHVKNYYQVIPIRNKESEALSMLRDTLLTKLISGELPLNKDVE